MLEVFSVLNMNNHMEPNVALLDVHIERSKELKLVISIRMNGNNFPNNINNKIYLVWNDLLIFQITYNYLGARQIHQNISSSIPHDAPSEPEARQEGFVKNYFIPGRFYFFETICAPCGVIIAWAKFDKAESPTNILNFLANVYPNEPSRPDYICIDKASGFAHSYCQWFLGDNLEKYFKIYCWCLPLPKSQNRRLSMPKMVQFCTSQWFCSKFGDCCWR